MFIGKKLRSRYQITQKLGSGGFGKTYLANDRNLIGNLPCVVKHLQPKNCDSNPQILEEAQKLFKREANCLNYLGKHDQIPALWDYFPEDDEFYLIQEFIDGNDLSQEISPGIQWSEEETIKLLQEILEILVVVHRKNIIHRDLKPQNIMRRKHDGKLVLIDFGAVKEISVLQVDSSGSTSFTVAVGSPGYMPPEQSQGIPKLASDIYAVGMIGLQALTGLNCSELRKSSNGEYCCDSVTENLTVSSGFASVLDKMVRYDYRQRHQNASEALEALNNFQALQEDSTVFVSITDQNQVSTERCESNCYIQRPPIEDNCYQEILKPGSLIRIKAPQKMGKTLLLENILDGARKEGYQTVKLNLRVQEDAVFRDYRNFLQFICADISDSLDLEEEIDHYWKDILSLNKNCTRYFQRYLLKKIDSPLVFALDNFEQLFSHPEIFENFCRLLRGWYEASKQGDRVGKVWKKMRLIVAHSTEDYPSLDTNHSPFNVGYPIELPEFTQQQVEALVRYYQLDKKLGEQDLRELVALIGGHPFLIQKVCESLKNEEMTWEKILQLAATEESIFSDHLRQLLWQLQQQPKLEQTYKKVVLTNKPLQLDSEYAFKLHSLGLVKIQGNYCVPSCHLYRQYFSNQLAHIRFRKLSVEEIRSILF